MTSSESAYRQFADSEEFRQARANPHTQRAALDRLEGLARTAWPSGADGSAATGVEPRNEAPAPSMPDEQFEAAIRDGEYEGYTRADLAAMVQHAISTEFPADDAEYEARFLAARDVVLLMDGGPRLAIDAGAFRKSLPSGPMRDVAEISALDPAGWVAQAEAYRRATSI